MSLRLAPKIFNNMNPNEDEPRIIAAPRTKNTMDSDQQDIFERMDKQIKVVQPVINTNTRKKMPEEILTTPEKDAEMDIENKQMRILRYKDLPEEVVFYITEIFPYAQKLFITGVTEEGHTLNLVATQPLKQLYFCLRSEFNQKQSFSSQFLAKAEREITQRLHEAGINKFHGQFEEKTYVFEIEDIPRVKRPYYKVRYPFGKDKDQITADCQGQTFKYVFGTTYNPLQLFVLNTGIKGPGWVKVEKQFLNENNRLVQGSLCCEIQDPELLQVVNEITRTPSMRVMSISLKAVVPSQVKLKKLFNTNRIEELHVYAISYFFCEEYQIQSKPINFKGISRTFYLKEFGGPSTKDMHSCENERQMFAALYSDIRRLDPDVIVCHDGAKIIDTLIQRMNKVVEKSSERPKLGRLNYSHQFSKSNQTQRIVSSLAGRLLCDTFLHSRDMIKSVDYELQEMAKHIKPERVFKGMGEEQTLSYLNDNKAFHVVRKVKEQAEITFSLMNHLQILQITRQLSNICGNIWRRSLDIQRAQRNQFLIMHECVKRDLIIPDKFRKDKNQDDEDTDKKKYQGGHVIDPMKGFYKEYILLLDFNSLYPSIIREYNVCFSKIKRPLVPLSNYYKPRKGEKKVKEEHVMKDQNNEQKQEQFEVCPPERMQCEKDKWGFLPQLIDKIVERRKKAKKEMKKALPQKAVILDIQQKCYKLVANSIYGCLGFSISRFYSKHLAALITRMGREALLRAKDIVSSTSGVRVIYGDTDSLMIQPQNLQGKSEKEKLFDIKAAAQDLKKNINKQYSNLEIDVDGIFKPLILLMKKKYVARKLNNFDQVILGKEAELKFSIEHKGIEVVRRDGCELQRQFLKEIIRKLMESDKAQPQQTYEQIYNYAKEFNNKITNKEFSFKDFLFSKQLSKPPGEYARGQTIPHVKVAHDRLKAGQRVETLVNHTIFYLVCQPKEKSQDSLAKCCFDDRAYERSQKFVDEKGPLEIDYEYYKRELLQPVGRITQHLEDFSTDRLLEEIGLSDQARKKFKRQMEIERDDGEAVLQGCISHSGEQKGKRFSELLGQITCACSSKIIPTLKGKFTLSCQACQRPVLAAISNKISLQLKQQVAEYYNNNYKCKCGRTYSLNPIGDCCKIKFKPRSNIPFEIHELAYLTKDLCMSTSRNAPIEVQSKLSSLESKLQKFLEESDFEVVMGLNKILKL